MKILTIGDVHGKSVWKNFADINMLLYSDKVLKPEYDLYIFLGDYCDSYDVSNIDIKNNLLDIIEFKKLYPDNVILILGNHDVPYSLNEPWKPLNMFKYNCSGHRSEMHFDLYDIFNNNKNLFQLAFQYKNYIWTHAGVHYGWYHYVFSKKIKELGIGDLNVAEQLNEAFKFNLDCLFDVDWQRGGTKKVGGPLWVDKKFIGKKPLKHTHQIVGHNPVPEIVTYEVFNSKITFCDVLANKDEFFSLEI
jgi:predicted phosphodiesterase